MTEVKADHVLKLREKLEPALIALGLPHGSYAHPGLSVGSVIYAIDFQELRDQMKAAWLLKINWLVTDQLGTPRMIFDQSGSLATTSRHDYLPFGEELFANTGGRMMAQGYTAIDNVRQKFTSKERDNETGLDYFGVRYYGSIQGRFTGPDPLASSAFAVDPQTWNRYAYVTNNSLRFIDDDGQIKRDAHGKIKFEVREQNVSKGHPGAPGDVFRGDVVILHTDSGSEVQAFRQYPAIDDRMRFDCHGLTFGDAQFFINNDQVGEILKGDKYEQTNEPQIGDVVVYTDANGSIVHSATVSGVDEQGKVTEVTGLGGIDKFLSSSSAERAFYVDKTRSWATPSYWRKPGTAEERRDNARRVTSTGPKNLLTERDLRALGKPPKPPKSPRKKKDDDH